MSAATLRATRVSDDWSCEFHFADEEIELGGGVLVGSFGGVAELAPDSSYPFYVKAIVLDGRKRVPRPGFYPRALGLSNPEPVKMILTKDAEHPFERELFRLLASQIENSRDALEHFMSEREPA